MGYGDWAGEYMSTYKHVHSGLQTLTLSTPRTCSNNLNDSHRNHTEKNRRAVAASLSSVCVGLWNGKREDGFCREFTQTGDLKERRFSGWFPEDHPSWYKRLYCFASVLLVPGTIIRQERCSQWLEELMNCSEFFPEHLGVLLLSY